MNIRAKIIVPVVVIITALFVIMTIFTSMRFTEYTGFLLSERVAAAANAVKMFLADCERNSELAAITTSNDEDVIKAIKGNDREAALQILSSSLDLYHVDFLVVTDGKGRVIARTHEPEIYGDSITDQISIREALKGNILVNFDEGALIKVAVCAGVPVYDSDGNIIGTIMAGVRLDTLETVDYLKGHYQAEFSVFYGDTRIATTIFRNGERIVGTKIDPEIAKIVIGEKKEYFGYAEVLGENYSALYFPLLNDDGEVFAVFFAGKPNTDLITERAARLRVQVGIGIVGLAVSILLLWVIISRILAPVKRLVGISSEVAKGNIDVDIEDPGAAKDELSIFTNDVYALARATKSMTIDVSSLINSLNERGDIDYQIDSNKYSGSFKEIIDGFKTLANSIYTMRKTVAVIDSLDSMITVIDFDYNLLYINESMAEMYGVDRDNCLGQKCHKVIRGYDKPCPVCHLEQLLPDKDSYPLVEYEKLFEEVAGLYIGGRAAIIRWVDGAQVFFNSIRDETERMNYQENLHAAVEAAQAATVAKSEFLANMSHEIRTPMNSIIGFSELAMDSQISERTMDYLHRIRENSDWLLQIINDILDLSKVEAGHMELEIIPFNLQELFESCKTILMPKTVEKDIHLDFYIEASIGKKVLGDPMRLRQVLINLLSNAVKFTDSGRVKLLAILEEVKEDSATLRFEIADSGIGMTEEQIKRVFEPFIQADATTTRKYGGTGLGLSIAKNLVELMGGVLDIQSTPGVGTTISFVLTFETGERINELEASSNMHEIEKPFFEGDVLVCEDNPMNQRVILEHLERVGLNVEIAENGQEGVDKIRQRLEAGGKPFDLIFMDIHMPVMDGIEATPKIMELGTGSPIVAMTANIMSGDKERYKSLGMKGYVGKPFTSQELWRCLLIYFKPIGFKPIGGDVNEKDDALQKQLKTDFVKSNQATFDDITGAIDSGDIKLAHRLAHSLKSSAGLIGRSALQKAAAAVEASLKGEENRATEKQLSKLKSELGAALDDLSPYLTPPAGQSADEASASAPGLDAGSIKEILDELEPLVVSGSTECLGFVDGLRAVPGSEELIRQLEDFEFGPAAKTLAEMKEKLG